jgi:hypothetical protein
VDTATYEHFQPLLGTGFALQVASGDTLATTLVEAQPLGMPPVGGRQPFSLLFLGPPSPVLPQSIYGMVHESAAVPAMELFIVPVRASREGTYYEAVFA